MMPSRALLLLAAATLCAAAAPARPPAKPAAGAAFDSQNPQSLTDLLAGAGAKAATPRRDGDAVFVGVSSAAADFSLQFAGCGAQGRGCQAVLFDSQLDGAQATLGQINSFNQTSVACRLYQDRMGRAHATYAALLLRSDTRDSATTHLAAWQGCLGQARDFARDPAAYLADAA